MPDQPLLPFRIRMVDLPPPRFGAEGRIEAGLQRGQEIEQSQAPVGESLEFAGELRLKAPAGGAAAAPIFLGPCTQGPPSARFLYISWTGDQQGRRTMFRRMKLPLKSITWDQIDQVLQQPGAILVATVAGTDRRGGPACATVSLLGGGWQVEHPGAPTAS